MEKCSFNPTDGDIACINKVNENMCVSDCYQCELGAEENKEISDETE